MDCIPPSKASPHLNGESERDEQYFESDRGYAKSESDCKRDLAQKKTGWDR